MRRIVVLLVGLAVVLVPTTAQARWNPAGSGHGYAEADVAPDGNAPTVGLSGRNTTLSWTASQFVDGTNVNGYLASRYDAGTGTAATIGSNCAGTINGLTCTENAVPPGTWYYTITPKYQNWIGGESLDSAAVTIDPPSLVFTTLTNITTLPKTLNGNIFTFLAGETVAWRLDNPTTGTLLTGTNTPNPVPASGTAATTVTIPVGTSNGTHTVYAIGSGGSVASATIAVNVADVTAPVVTATAIAKTAGGTQGFVRQGGTYYVYANANDPGTPTSGVAQVRANVATVTTGSTNIVLNAGSFTIGGVTYGYRSNALTASNPLAAGVKSYTVWAVDSVGNVGATSGGNVTVDNTAPAPTGIQTTNAGIAGKAESGDKIVFTFGEAMEPTSIVTGWTGAAATTVTVRVTNNGGSDRVQIWNAANTTQLPLGQIRLNRADYVTATSNFTGSSMTLVGGVVTVTLGSTTSTSVTTAAGTGTMRWTPSATATDLAGNGASTGNFNETGAADVDF